MEKIAVRTGHNEFLIDALITAMKIKGVNATEGFKNAVLNYNVSSLCISPNERGLEYCREPWYAENGYKIITVDEFFRDYYPNISKPIKIGSHIINSITQEGFKVGCQSVTWAEYDEIGKLRPEEGE